MGQYYIIVNLDKKEYLKSYSGVKLMEFSYCYNNTTRHLTSLLANGWFADKVICLGDYTDENAFMKYRTKVTTEIDNFYSYVCEYYTCVNHEGNYNNWDDACDTIQLKANYDYVINLSTKEFFRLSALPQTTEYYRETESGGYRYIGSENTPNLDLSGKIKEHKVSIYALTLLLCTSNGRGGGDYDGDDEELCGYWVNPGIPQGNETLDDWEWLYKNSDGYRIGICKDEADCQYTIENWLEYTEIFPKFKVAF